MDSVIYQPQFNGMSQPVLTAAQISPNLKGCLAAVSSSVVTDQISI